MTEVVAALDCGSNSTRLLIASPEGALRREMTITRLSEGVDGERRLSDAALARSLDVLRTYRRYCDDAGVTRGLLVATSAVRDAVNGEDFLVAARDVVGFEARLLSGNEEAIFSYNGATADLVASDLPTVIVDVGGGSTELAGVIDDQLVSYSMQLGCVRVSERALGSDVVTHERERSARAMIEAELNRAFSAVSAFSRVKGAVRLVGLAGSVATLAQLDAQLSVYDRAVVHHRVLTREVVTHWYEVLRAESPAARLAHPGMVRGREDVLAAGLLILDAVMERFGVPELVTSESDILDGIVAALLSA